MCLPRVRSLKFRLKNWVYRCLKNQNFKGLTVNLVHSLFKQCFHVQILFFFVERNLMGSSYILWNKFQDYQLRFILTNHFLVSAWPVISRELESCLLTARQHGSYNNHINRRFSDTLECTVIVVQWKRKLKMASWAKWFLSYNYLISDDCIWHSGKIIICNT